jgi:hypothetical protein
MKEQKFRCEGRESNITAYLFGVKLGTGRKLLIKYVSVSGIRENNWIPCSKILYW